MLPKSTLENWRLQRELFSLFHTSQSHFTNQGNYKLSWFWNWQTDVPLNAWHSTSISRKGDWKKKKVFSAGSMIEMLEFFPKEEIQIHNSTLFACFSKLDFQPWRLSRSASCQNMTYTTGTETSTCEKQTMTIKISSPWVGPKKERKLFHWDCARKRLQLSWHCSHGQKAVWHALGIHSIALTLKHSYAELDHIYGSVWLVRLMYMALCLLWLLHMLS